MNIQHNNVQIMWKEIVIIFLFIYIIRCITDVYIIIVYKKNCKKFYAHNWLGLEKTLRRHQNMCAVFSNGPFNKKIRLIYNGLCVILASIALINKKDIEFVTELNHIKKDDEFELKPFVLALYFRSKNDLTMAMKFYHKYCKCIHQDKNIDIIMKYLFAKQECKEINTEMEIAIKSFRNPAIIKLFEKNNLLNIKEE